MGMRTRVGWFAVLLAALVVPACAGKIITDPNAGGKPATPVIVASDPALAKKVTCEARHRAVHLILQDLSDMTGVKLIAGATKNDWPRARPEDERLRQGYQACRPDELDGPRDEVPLEPQRGA